MYIAAEMRSILFEVNAAISEAGLALLAEMDQPVFELHERQMMNLSKERMTVLVELLETLRP